MIFMHVTTEKVRAAIFGAAVGDAVGVPFEFNSPEEMKRRPAKDMVGGGTYHLPAGTWSDDTSMILCTLDKLDETLNYDAIMQAFLSWVNDGDYSPHGDCFDIGFTTRSALVNYARFHDVYTSGLDSSRANGNGSLMRIIPAALYADAHDLSPQDSVALAHMLSQLTHAHMRSRIGCGIFTCIAMALLKNPDKSSVREGIETASALYSSPEYAQEATHYARVLSPDFADLPEADINSAGYVVSTLECAVWCLMNTENYRDCILKAVNFGEDTDTAACVAGALAGLLYGFHGIPSKWRALLVKSEAIDAVMTGFCERNNIK